MSDAVSPECSLFVQKEQNHWGLRQDELVRDQVLGLKLYHFYITKKYFFHVFLTYCYRLRGIISERFTGMFHHIAVASCRDFTRHNDFCKWEKTEELRDFTDCGETKGKSCFESLQGEKVMSELSCHIHVILEFSFHRIEMLSCRYEGRVCCDETANYAH